MRPILPRRTIRQDSHKREQRPDPLLGISVPELDGTQYGVFSEPEVLDTAFEIEVVVYPTAPEGTYYRMLSGGRDVSPSNFNSESDGRLGISTGGIYRVSSTILNRNQIQTVTAVRTGIDIELKNVSTGQTSVVAGDGGAAIFDTIGINNSGVGSVGPFFGGIFSVRIWKNGDRSTGQLATDIRFDQRDTDYQRDYSVPVGAELASRVFSDYVAAGGLPDVNQDGDYIVGTSAPDGGFERIATYIDDEFEVGEKYLIIAEAESSDVTAFYIQGQNSRGRVAVTGRSGSYTAELLWTATDMGCLIALESSNKPNNNLKLNYTTLSVKKWSGCVLQNMVHGPEGNWLDLEKKHWWDYWLSRNDIVARTINDRLVLNGGESSAYPPFEFEYLRDGTYTHMIIPGRVGELIHLRIQLDIPAPCRFSDNTSSFPAIIAEGETLHIGDHEIINDSNILLYPTKYGSGTTPVTGRVIELARKIIISGGGSQ